MTAGLLGGPIVGLYASLIGAVYVYFFSSPQAFAMASAFSTMLFGLLGGGFYPYFQRGKWKYKDLFLLTCFAEVCDMVSLLRFTVPVQMALNTILEISVPMIVMNAVGILIFISSFNNVFVQQDLERSRQLQQASELMKKCLPQLLKGLEDKENMEKFARIILEETDWAGVMVTNKNEIIADCQRETSEQLQPESGIPDIGVRAMETRELETMYRVPHSSAWYECMKDYSLVAAPIVIREQAIGCLIVWVKKQWVFRQSELELLSHLVLLSSYQIALAELERQKDMCRKAEFKALQFQVNPHFLFNSLNVLVSLINKNQETAVRYTKRLSTVYRYVLTQDVQDTVTVKEETEFIENYISILKIRFDKGLEFKFDIESDDMLKFIPPMSLQLLIENAVKHNAVLPHDPLVIRIFSDGSDLYVSNNLIPRISCSEGTGIGLKNLSKKYAILAETDIAILRNKDTFTVKLPLLRKYSDLIYT